uniref:Bublin coiled coil protein n=1 Tax=Equus asinus TaxID=9793 RepID=A0A9L0JMD4_EQUAS
DTQVETHTTQTLQVDANPHSWRLHRDARCTRPPSCPQAHFQHPPFPAGKRGGGWWQLGPAYPKAFPDGQPQTVTLKEAVNGNFPHIEYAAINSMLDQINSCLDHLEEKNDHLHARLQELLESNRQTRLEFQQQLGEAPSDASP